MAYYKEEFNLKPSTPKLWIIYKCKKNKTQI
jgi:hypothetical protein